MECAKSRASFFKVMIDRYKETLFLQAVPQKFARIWGNLLGKTTHLEDSDGRRWAVRVSEVDGRLSFQQGWDEFVDQHSIVFGELLVFTYSRRSSFAVQIFGTSGCERRHFPRTARATEESSVAQRLVRRKSFASGFLRRNGKKSEISASIYGCVRANSLTLDHQIAPLIVLGDDEGEEQNGKKTTPANLLTLDHQIAPLIVLRDDGGEEENGKKTTPANWLTLDHPIASLIVLSDDEGEEEQTGKKMEKKKKPARILRSARAKKKADPAMVPPHESSGRSTHRSKREPRRGAP